MFNRTNTMTHAFVAGFLGLALATVASATPDDPKDDVKPEQLIAALADVSDEVVKADKARPALHDRFEFVVGQFRGLEQHLEHRPPHLVLQRLDELADMAGRLDREYKKLAGTIEDAEETYIEVKRLVEPMSEKEVELWAFTTKVGQVLATTAARVDAEQRDVRGLIEAIADLTQRVIDDNS